MSRTLTSLGPATDHARAARRWPAALWRALKLLALLAPLLMGAQGTARAQDTAFKTEELDQMLAPIALYPDSLLSQILMASTYPADVKDAAAWSKAHPDAKGEAALGQVASQPWEPAVQSLVAFPQVLAMMAARPDDVQRLGDAFLADPARLMDRVQVLRAQAQKAGNLKTTEQQKVIVQTEASKQVIIIEPAQPQIVYVPVYQPTVVYGSWYYPSYPPYYWAPPRYYYPPGAAFVGGVLWGAAIVGVGNSLWGGYHWGRNEININVNNYNNVNVNRKIDVNNTNYTHNADRRRDVPYRDSKSREQYSKKPLEGAGDREAYRGKDERSKDVGANASRDAQRDKAAATLKDRGADPVAGRDKLQGAEREKAAAAVAKTDRAALPERSDRVDGAGARDRGVAKPSSQVAHNDAFSGTRDPGAARADASRGVASRDSMAQRTGGGSTQSSAMSRPAPSTRPAPAARPAPSARPAPAARPMPAARPAPGGHAGALKR